LDIQEKLIETITTSIFYLKLKENNENCMAAHAFWAVHYTADLNQPNDVAAIPPPILFLSGSIG
jgi:hypothetical protein